MHQVALGSAFRIGASSAPGGAWLCPNARWHSDIVQARRGRVQPTLGLGADASTLTFGLGVDVSSSNLDVGVAVSSPTWGWAWTRPDF
jgi:hypothetical protein